jgi:hypothetical protein
MIAYIASGLPGLEARARTSRSRAWSGRSSAALLAVPVGARRIHHADDRLLDAEALLGDLGDHEVGVVARGRGDEHIGALDPRLDQRVGLERRADGELAAGVLPALALPGVQALVGERVLVEDRDFVPAASADFATAEPTRPAPTISTNIFPSMVGA